MLKYAAFAAVTLAASASTASAQQGLYYGLSLGVQNLSSRSAIGPNTDFTGTDAFAGATVGYRWAASETAYIGLEGQADFGNGGVLNYGAINRDACTGWSPTWCNVDSVFRLRATLGSQMANGDILSVMVGASRISGRLEDGVGNYSSGRGTGVSFGVAWERSMGAGTVRTEANYDIVINDNSTFWQREVGIFGLRVSYLF